MVKWKGTKVQESIKVRFRFRGENIYYMFFSVGIISQNKFPKYNQNVNGIQVYLKFLMSLYYLACLYSRPTGDI